jgi:hypothetical protein
VTILFSHDSSSSLSTFILEMAEVLPSINLLRCSYCFETMAISKSVVSTLILSIYFKILYLCKVVEEGDGLTSYY